MTEKLKPSRYNHFVDIGKVKNLPSTLSRVD